MKSNLIRLFRGSSLRQRFLVAPLLGLVVCSLLTAAFIYESQRQNALLIRAERDLTAFNHYADVFVNLTEQHTALYDLLNSAGKIDEATLYDHAKQHLHKVHEAVRELEQALPAIGKSVAPDFAALRNELSASAQAYRKGVSAAVGMATLDVALAPDQLALANERFTAMNRSFARFLDLERGEISSEITAGVRQSRISNSTIAFIGVSIAGLLFFLSRVLSRILCRSIEAQIGILTDLGAQAGACLADDGSDEVERMARAIAAFRQSLLDLNVSHAELVEHKRELEKRIAETQELNQSNTALTTNLTEMKRIDRMKSEFVSMVSHELRTPLTSIRGSLGLLAGGVAGSLPDAAKNLVDIAKNNCERLVRLINDILDTEKIESGQMRLDLEVVDLQSLVAQTLTANEGFAGQHQVGLALRVAQGTMRANVDADRLVQVVTNLLSNAIKFSPARSTVEVILSRDAGRVRVEVRDRGPGIPEEFRSRIFQKFSQADSSDSRQKSGSGLGLNISKTIVERLGGTMGFSSEAGVGTSFFFELPEWQDKPAAVTRPPRMLRSASSPRIAST